MNAYGKRHPTFLFIYFLSVLLTVMFVPNPVFQLTSLLGGALFSVTLKKGKKKRGDILFYILIFVVITVSNPLFSHNGTTPLFFMNGKAITLEAFAYGASLAAVVLSVIVWFGCFNAVMTSDKLLYLFSKAASKLALIVSMSMKFIPVMISRTKKVSRAQKAMGFYSSDSRFDRLRNGGRVFASMVAWSLENSVDTSVSMKSRGYGLKGRTSFFLFSFKASDAVMTAITLALLSLVLAGSASGATRFYFYPAISALGTSPLAVMSYISFAILSFLPFAAEVKEALVWKYCISKI